MGQKVVPLGVLLIFLLHSVGVALLFDPVAGLFDNQPVIEQDWGLHFHHLKSMDGFWKEGGRIWGYNPFFMAGYPSNTIQDLSIKLFEFLSLLLSGLGLDLMQAFKLLVFLATAGVPWMMFFAASNFFDEEGSASTTALLAALLGTAYWWNSFPREMFFYGMVGFPLASYFSLMTLSLFYRILKSERVFTPAHVAWVAAAVMILPLHFQTVLILTPAAVALLIVRWKSLHYQRVLLWLGVAITVSLLANLVWILPLFGHLGDDVSSSIVKQVHLFMSSDPLTFLKDYLRPEGYSTFRASFWEKGLRWTVLILGASGIYELIRSEQRDIGVMLACAVLTLFLVTYFGFFVPFFQGWQPLRFKVSYDLFLVLATSSVATVWLRAGPKNPRFLLVSSLLIIGTITLLANIIQTESEKDMTLRTQVAPEVKAIVEWVRSETPSNGRVLFEESGDETGFVYDGMYLSSFIPHDTGRQLIGGPINLYNDRRHFAEFHSGRLFQRDVTSFTDEELRDYFQTYNIGAIIAFHSRSVQRFRSIPQLISLDLRIDEFHLMKVKQSLSWFLKGKGKVEAGWNRIHCSNIKGDEVILKYHWTEGLVSDPPVNLMPVRILDDPIPFIKVLHPPPEFTLRIGN